MSKTERLLGGAADKDAARDVVVAVILYGTQDERAEVIRLYEEKYGKGDK